MIEIVILILTILNFFGVIFLVIFKLVERLAAIRVKKFVVSQTSSIPVEKVEFPPPPSPPLEESGVISGSAQEAELMESATEESSDEREYLEEQKRISQRGQL